MKRLIVLLAALLALPYSAGAQTLTPTPYQTVLDNSGKIINAGCVWTYAAGTTTAAATYTDAGLATPNPNPIKSDAAGRFVAYLQNGLSFKFVYEAPPCATVANPTLHGVTLKTVDNIATVPQSNVNLDVTGTAGQALSANDVVFLSDGSRGNVAGLWYQADADFQDASVNALTIGIAPAAISNGASGTIRISGRVTALSGLTPGAAYYVSATAGQLTSVQPLLGRFVGEADTTTTLILTANPKKDLIQPPSLASCGRLTGTSGVAVTTTDVTAATSIFFTPYTCDRIALFDGTSVWNLRTFTEITISITACTASKPYDVFIFDNAGTPAAETLVWTSATARATALVLQNGIWVKTGATSRRYVGSFYCNASGGQTDDTLGKRNLFNMDNRVLRALRRIDTTANWTYNSGTVHQANAATANQIETMVGISEDAVSLFLTVNASGTIGDYAIVNIGLDSTTTPVTGGIVSAPRLSAGTETISQTTFSGYPGVGYHTLTWLESRSGANTVTFYGQNGVASQSGLQGTWRN